MYKHIITLALITSVFTFAGCETEEEDPTDNGVAENTLVAGGVSIAMSSVVCSETGSGNDLSLIAADLSQNNFLYIRFKLVRPTTSALTVPLSPSGSASEAYGTFTVDGVLEYEIKSGNATLTPGANNTLTITFTDVVAETENDVSITLNFNGTCS